MTKKELEDENKELKRELESWRKGDLISCSMQNFERLYIGKKRDYDKLKDYYIEETSKLIKQIR